MGIVLKVKTRCCRGCQKNVNKVIRKIEGVDNIIIDADKDQVTIYGQVDYTTVIRKLKKAGKNAELLSILPENHNSSNNDNDEQPHNNRQVQNKADAKKKKKVRFTLPPKYFGGEEKEEEEGAGESSYVSGASSAMAGMSNAPGHYLQGRPDLYWEQQQQQRRRQPEPAPMRYYDDGYGRRIPEGYVPSRPNYSEDPLNFFHEDNANGCSIM